MIQFTLRCDKDHRFDSWFQSAEAFDKLSASGMVSCAVCGSSHVEKALMAPRVQDSRRKTPEPPEPPKAAARTGGALSAPAGPVEQAIAALRQQIEANSEYVGLNFAREARDMHDGIAPARSIYGEAKPDEARKLIEDGIPVAPLPFLPGRKSN